MIKKSIKEWAQFYIDHGFRPMPVFSVEDGCKCKNPSSNCIKDQCFGKVPSISNWPDKQIDINCFDNADNLSLIMGKQDDGRWFLGFDIDGDFSFDGILDLPETLECSTARGRHLIFRVSEDLPLGNWNDIFSTRESSKEYKKGYKGAVDLRYCRGSLVSPPSKTHSGSFYEWNKWMEPTFLDRYETSLLIRLHKKNFPNVETYRTWTSNPTHKGKKP